MDTIVFSESVRTVLSHVFYLRGSSLRFLRAPGPQLLAVQLADNYSGYGTQVAEMYFSLLYARGVSKASRNGEELNSLWLGPIPTYQNCY